jgi:ATP-binding cassette subfamily B protein
MRFHEINDGKITIDWINTKDMTREYIHSLFCMVLQDTWVFDWTIRENIAYNKEDATEEEIIKASKAVWLHHFVTTLPKWYDTILEQKVSLSTWQKQQLTIARAMVYNAPMLILD